MASPNELNRADEFTVTVVRDVDGLAAHEAAREALVSTAIEPNVFYEPWMLIPALRAFGAGRDLRIVFVYAPDPARADGPSFLCGVFPLFCAGYFRCNDNRVGKDSPYQYCDFRCTSTVF